jgi:hypothetical protein
MNDNTDIPFAFFYIAIAMVVVITLQLLMPLLGVGLPF